MESRRFCCFLVAHVVPSGTLPLQIFRAVLREDELAKVQVFRRLGVGKSVKTDPMTDPWDWYIYHCLRLLTYIYYIYIYTYVLAKRR